MTFPLTTIEATVSQQNSTFTTVNVLQPITDLLKVRQGVKIAQADEQIAKADRERGTRELVSGVEQLYWGLLAARRIQQGAMEEMLALRKEAEKQAGAPPAMMAAVKTRMLAEVDFIKADLAYRQGYVQLMSLVGQQ